MKQEDKRLLKPEQVAEMLGLARKTIITMCREGRIPHLKIGRFVRFDPTEIRRWIDSRRR